MFPNWAKSLLFLLVFMISGLVLVIIIEGLLSGTELIPLNTVIERAVVHMRTPFLTTILVALTRLSDPFVLASAAALIAILSVMRNRPYEAVLFVVTIIVAVVSLTVLKNTFQVARPASQIIAESGWSFPSGHATMATVFFFMLTYCFIDQIKTPFRKTLLILSSILGVILVSFSRLYLGAHWALDILGGVALGLLSVSFTVLILSITFGDRRSLRNRISM